MKLCKLKLRIEAGFTAVVVISMLILNYLTGSFYWINSKENMGESKGKIYLIVLNCLKLK